LNPQKPGPGRGGLFSSRASLIPHEEGEKEKKETHKKKETIPKKIPERSSTRGSPDGDSEASAIDVEAPGDIEDQRAEKDQQEKIADENRSGQPDAGYQAQTQQQFEPRKKEGDEVDE
jgi:hypothetical protein